MSHYKPYPAYKDSGVEWLGKVPEHWQVMAIKHIVSTPITDGPHETPEFLDDGVPFVSAEAVSAGKVDFEKIRGFISREDHERYSQKYCPQRGDIFMIKSGATTGVTAIVDTDEEFNIWSPLAVIRCGGRSAPYFVLNFMRSRSFQEAVTLSWSYGTQQNIGMGVIGNLAVTVPPQEEQQVIAAHLDRETTRIDALIEKKTRFIELLREKRQALITHAVTKGLNPNVKMKNSGVEWLGEVPEHWVVAPMKYVCELLKDGTHLPPPRTDEGVPLLSVRNIIDGHFTLRDDDSTISHQDYMELCKAFIPEEGDVLLAVVGATLGKTALIPAALGQFHIQRSLAIFRPHHGRMNSCWLHLVFQSSLFQSLLWEHAGYSAQPGIYLGTLAGFSIPQPPLNEQTQIFSYLSERTARLDSLIRTTESSIELLKERRSALITAAVTGQIDLREAV
ncbi:TPA: restriction endonuclease subunit S [Pseudomonas aeruginosa]|uniref:restriction endonuclease subunit S n=1 Tax=Pseudomonas aeruginosa TaxID=287 RepID=UPI000940A560|nr:restriction endonuclease subunit S [Pseudomonas aeruginosa]ELK4903460.1 restriction endonuclease subunit S [Pseudomonas aeruginosa]MBG6610848.1 restriction endonuclease subunit S [Pseudomonas aeruginosa]RTX39609.1 restriction endonuclease subunit S [Pseudomonas aeruginosa]HEJ1300646.1 restriction endonuclease subunit S [Pseudomonas aeruginosa]HEJ2204327.1 restriction endonuclease subunit S [Pseudomonas aeruginosa]